METVIFLLRFERVNETYQLEKKMKRNCSLFGCIVSKKNGFYDLDQKPFEYFEVLEVGWLVKIIDNHFKCT